MFLFQVVIHSLLLSQGKKMSKSKGNVIDPMSIINGSTLAVSKNYHDIEEVVWPISRY